MRKALLALIIALVALSVTSLVILSDITFGGGRGRGAQEAPAALGDLRLVWLLVIIVLVIVISVVAYLIVFPEIKPISQVPKTEERSALDAVLKVLNDDERKVVEAVATSKEGNILQKEIRWKTNLSRVKTHRVIARLSERGIIKVEKHFNTNKVTLAEWINKNQNVQTDD